MDERDLMNSLIESEEKTSQKKDDDEKEKEKEKKTDEQYDEDMTPEELMRKYPNMSRDEAEKISDGWWQDPAGGWHSPDEDDPASQYESMKSVVESTQSSEEIVKSLVIKESIFSDRDVNREELIKVLDKHGIPEDKIDDYSTDLFRLPDNVVTDELIDDLNKIRAFRK